MPEPIRRAMELQFDLFESQIIYMTNSRSTVLGVYRSTDGGHTWEPMNEGFDPVPQICHLLRLTDKPGELFAATNTGLWLWTDQQSSPGPGDVSPARLRIEAVGPCPFRDWLRAELSLSNRDVVHARIYSLSGGVVQTLLNCSIGPGTHALSWDSRDDTGKEVAPGAYLLSARSAHESTQRVVIKVE